MNFKMWLESNGWDDLDSFGRIENHQALPPYPDGPPPVSKGMVRLYRGTKIGELPHENAFFSDERGLQGIAKAFAKIPGRQLVFVDVPMNIAKAGSQLVAVTDGEYKVPEQYRRMIRIIQ